MSGGKVIKTFQSTRAKIKFFEWKNKGLRFYSEETSLYKIHVRKPAFGPRLTEKTASDKYLHSCRDKNSVTNYFV